MIWLTDQERAENSRKDKEAQKLGFRTYYDMEKFRDSEFDRSKLKDLMDKKHISYDDIRFIIECYKNGLANVGL